jgi:Tfp pilus assembly PilM family ATPase
LDLKQRFSDLFDRLGVEALPPRFPDVAVEVAPDRITAVRLAVDRKGGKPRLAAVESRPLPDGAVEVALAKPNILEPAALLEALRSIFVKIAPKDHRISLLLPDDVARVSLLGFTALPKSRRELIDLVRFRMSKSLPFKPEEAVMDLMILGGGAARPGASSVSVLAAFIHRAVLEQYESVLAACGYWPGLVSLSTFELFNLFRPVFARNKAADRDSLVLNVTRHYLSVVILRDTDVIFYRCKPHVQAANGDSLGDVRREIYTSLAFYQEKLLGRGIGRVFLRCAGLPPEELREAAGAETGGEVEILDPLAIVPLNGAPSISVEVAALIAPALGAVAGRTP